MRYDPDTALNEAIARLAEVEAERDHYKTVAYLEHDKRQALIDHLAAVEAVLADGPVEPDPMYATLDFDLRSFDAGVDATKALIETALRGEGDRPDSMGAEICWDCCKPGDHARHGEGDRPAEGTVDWPRHGDER